MNQLQNNFLKLENIVYATGRLTKEPSFGETKEGKRYAKFTLASDKKPTRKSEEAEKPNFIPVEIYGDEIVGSAESFLKKGNSVEIIGSIRTGSYENSQGNKVFTWKVNATGVSELPEGAMVGMSAVIFTGKLHSDSKISYTNNGNSVCVTDLFIEVGRRFGDGKDFIPATLYGKLGETLGRYLVKDQVVTVRGRIDTGSYVNSKKVTVYTWRVIADDMYLVGKPLRETEEEPEEAVVVVEGDEESGFIDLPPEFDDEYYDF